MRDNKNKNKKMYHFWLDLFNREEINRFHFLAGGGRPEKGLLPKFKNSKK
jgi:hypothetical protein